MRRTVFTLVLLISCTPMVFAATRIVRQDGAGGAFTTIQAAVTAADPNDIISIEDPVDAVYDEAVTINKNLTIADNSIGDVTLTKSFGPITAGVFNVSAGTVLISGFTIVDASGVAVGVSNTGNVTVQNCWVSGCDGDEGALGGVGHAAFDLFSPVAATLNLIDVTVDDTARTGHRFGPAVCINGSQTVLNALRCRFVTEAHVGGSGPSGSGEFASAITVVFGAVANLTECIVEVDGDNGVFIALNQAGKDATANLRRCLFKNNDNNSSNHVEKFVSLVLGGCVLNATNTIFDGGGQQTTNEGCVVIGVPGNINLNYCTLVRGANGVLGIGDPTTLRVANCLIGAHGDQDIKWIDGSGNWDVHLASNHFWGSPNGHYPGFGGFGGNANFHLLTDTANTESTAPPGDVPFPGGDPAAVNYQIQTPGNSMIDLGVSTLLGSTNDDYDEVGVRPRAAARDKGAQEGQGPVATPTPEPTVIMSTLQRQYWNPYK